MTSDAFIPYQLPAYSSAEQEKRARTLFAELDARRSVREFSDRPVPEALIAELIRTASTAPSGAHKQPWTFCAVSSPAVKRAIREAAEKEEYENYHGRMSDDWLEDLAKFDTDWHKDFLTTAPWLIVLFKKAYDMDAEGNKSKNYYVNESVGIAAGFLLNAIHHAGLVSLTHTPSPMNFLQKVLDRPANERAFLLIPVGYPAEGAEVPVLQRKGLEEMTVWYE